MCPVRTSGATRYSENIVNECSLWLYSSTVLLLKMVVSSYWLKHVEVGAFMGCDDGFVFPTSYLCSPVR